MDHLWKTTFKKLERTWSAYPFKFFEGCLPKISLDPFLNTWTQMKME